MTEECIGRALEKKIAELEKKIEVINDDSIRIFRDIQLSLEANFKRIKKLEAWIKKEEILGKAMKVEMSNKLPEIMKGAKEELGINGIEKELSELEKYIKDHEMGINSLEARVERFIKHGHPGIKIKGDQNFEGIKELKRFDEASQKWSMNIEEVLQDLGDKLIGWQKEKQTDYDKKMFAKSLQHTIDKLGGEIEQYGRKDGNPSLSVKPTDTSKPPSCEHIFKDIDSYKICTECAIVIDRVNPSEQDIAGSARQTEYDEHLSWKGNLRKLMKGKVMVEKEDLEWLFDLVDDLTDKAEKFDHFPKFRELEKKYLEEQ